MEGIAEMFAELSGADEYEAQVTIEWWVRQRLEVHRESARTYRAVMRKALNERERQRYARSPEYRKIKSRQVVARRNRSEESRDAYRTYMREYMRRRYQQKKAERQHQPRPHAA